MRRVFKYENKYLEYKPYKIMFKLRCTLDEHEEYKDTWFCWYLYPRAYYTPVLCENIDYREDEDEEGDVDYEYFYATEPFSLKWKSSFDYLHYHNIKNIRIIDKFPWEWNEWKWSKSIHGWWWAHHPACDYDSINHNHDY